MAKKFYITTPIYYVNSIPHVGSAYTTIAADILARWHRLKGEKVFFLTGTDEHGQKIQKIAEKNGKKPKEFVDEIAGKFKEVWKKLNISNDNFIRTTDPEHEKEVKKILQELYDKKFIYKGHYESCYCEGCEQYLNKSDLVDGKCHLHPNRTPEIRKEESYLFKLSKFQDKLLKIIESGKFAIYPEKKRAEIVSFVKSGLNDIAISRKKSEVYWGIELPFDKNHTCYVWVDAFWNYITGLKKDFKKFWPVDCQLMANDIFRVHATIWPALLLALGYELPKNLFVHGYFTFGGQKISKSIHSTMSKDPLYYAEKYSVDSLRYFLIRNISFGEDGDFSETALIDRHNSELANKLGNLVSRVSALAETHGLVKTENKLIKKLKLKEIEKYMESFEIDKALALIFEFIDNCNEYVQEKQPWKTGDKKVLYELVDSIKSISKYLSPFMPETSEKIDKIFSGKIKKAEVLFVKIETEIKQGKVNKSERIEGIATMTDIVQYQDWEKVELRVGKIIKVEDIPGADKLYKLEIDVGKEVGKRTICAGIKQHYSKDELKGKKIILFCNLAPRMMRGIESKGMLLAAVNSDESKVILVSPEKDIEVGSKVR